MAVLDLDELRKAAQAAADSDDFGGIWASVSWAEKENSGAVLAGCRYDAGGSETPLTGHLGNGDPADAYTVEIAECADPAYGSARARFIALACPANILRLLASVERLEARVAEDTRDLLDLSRRLEDHEGERQALEAVQEALNVHHQNVQRLINERLEEDGVRF